MSVKYGSGCIPAHDWYVEWWDAKRDEYWYEPLIGFGYVDNIEAEDIDFRHYMTPIALSLDGESYVASPRSKNPELKNDTMQCLHVFKAFKSPPLYQFVPALDKVLLPREE